MRQYLLDVLLLNIFDLKNNQTFFIRLKPSSLMKHIFISSTAVNQSFPTPHKYNGNKTVSKLTSLLPVFW